MRRREGLNGAGAVAVSRDGKHVYVTSVTSSAVAVFARDRLMLGALTQLADPDGCIVNGPSLDIAGCTNTGKALQRADGVAVSPDGKHVYVAALNSNAVAVFARDSMTGKLTQLADPDGCIVNGPSLDIAGCTNTGKALGGANAVAVSPDGKNVYVVSDFSNAVAVFARDKMTGKLTQLADPDGCIVDGPSADIAGCTNTGKALNTGSDVAVSSNGKNVYVTAGSFGVAVFKRE
jgi:DNA-binding beta-propeller fold protein YncE